MSVDLGQYALEVLSAYAGALILLVGVIAASVFRARNVAKRLAEIEDRKAARQR